MSEEGRAVHGKQAGSTGGDAPARRRRRILQSAAIGVAALLAARLAWSAAEGWRLRAVEERISARYGSLNPSSLAPPVVPDSENRAILYRAAAEIVDLGRGGRKTAQSFAGSDPVIAPEESMRSAESLVEANRLALLLVQEGSRRPRANWEISYAEGMQARLPDLRGLLDLARLIQVNALLAVRAGRAGEAIGLLEEGFCLSSSLAPEPLLIVQMVRQSMDRLLMVPVRALLVHAKPDAAVLERLARVLPDERPPSFRAALVGELKILHDAMLAIESGRSLPDLTEDGILLTPGRWLIRPMAFNAHRRILLEMEDALEGKAGPGQLRAETAGAVRDGGWNPFYRIFTPAGYLGQVRARAAAAEARSALARTATALRRHRLDRGMYPESLRELLPAYLDDLPEDPFSGALPAYVPEGAGFSLRSAGEGFAIRDAGPPMVDELLSWSVPS